MTLAEGCRPAGSFELNTVSIQNHMTKKIVVSGKRKTSVARAILVEGSGKVSINRKDYNTLQMFDKLKIEEPIRIAEKMREGKITRGFYKWRLKPYIKPLKRYHKSFFF